MKNTILEALRIKKKFVLTRSEPEKFPVELEQKISRESRIVQIIEAEFFKASLNMPDVNLEQVLLDPDFDVDGKEVGFKPICGYSVGEEPKYIFFKVKNDEDVESTNFSTSIAAIITEELNKSIPTQEE